MYTYTYIYIYIDTCYICMIQCVYEGFLKWFYPKSSKIRPFSYSNQW